MSKKIEILGTGCAKCNKLEENAKKAVQLAGADATVTKISDLAQIAEWMLQAIENRETPKKLAKLKQEVRDFAVKFPLPSDL